MVVDITNRIFHHAIYPPRTPCTTYTKFLEENPVVERYTDDKCDVSVLYPKEVWRKIMLTMIVISYDVRRCGYTLTVETFKENNMVIDDDGELKFRKLKVYEDSPVGAPDLVAVAVKIEESFGDQDVLTKVDLLIEALRQTVGKKYCP